VKDVTFKRVHEKGSSDNNGAAEQGKKSGNASKHQMGLGQSNFEVAQERKGSKKKKADKRWGRTSRLSPNKGKKKKKEETTRGGIQSRAGTD